MCYASMKCNIHKDVFTICENIFINVEFRRCVSMSVSIIFFGIIILV